MRATVTLLAAALLLAATQVSAQTCTEPHYRWTEKTDESLASITPVRTTIGPMLRTWALLPFTSQAQFKCADRAGRERRVYSVLGWVRRVKTGETDGDWHVELTARQNSPIDSCIVVEIPPPDLSAK